MKRFLAACVLALAPSVASAQYPYSYGYGYALPTVPAFPGTYLSGPGYVVGGGYGAAVWSTPQFTVQSYNPYWMQQQQMYRMPSPYRYQSGFAPTNIHRHGR